MLGDFTSVERKRIEDVKYQIEQHLTMAFNKLDGFDNSYELKKLIGEHFVVSGGISASMFTATTVKDIDLYYRDTIVTSKLNELLEADFIKPTGRFHHFVKEVNPTYMVGEVAGKLITVNAITLRNKMQLIRLAGIKECQAIFDFKHCLPIYDIKNRVYKISRNAFDSLSTQTLMTHHTPLKDHRILKFKSRGWDFKTVNSP